MIQVRIIGFCLCFSIPCLANWTQEQKEWALGTAAILAQVDGDRLDVLAGADSVSNVAARDQQVLAGSWGIHSRADLLKTVRSLGEEKTNRDAVAWNYPRAVNLLRWGYAAGYISEQESWSLIMPLAQYMQQTFSSWHELGEMFVDARDAFYRHSIGDQRQGEYAYRVLMMDGASPWRKHPWNLDLGNNAEIPPAVGHPAMLIITPHPQGLLCVRLTTPETLAKISFVPVVAEMIGCRPHITSEQRRNGNWVVDGECLRREDLVGAQMIVPLHMEAIRGELRRVGIAQFFFAITYEAAGESELVPRAHDSWEYRGEQTYIGMRDLSWPIPDMTLKCGISPRNAHSFFAASGCFVLLTLAGAFGLRLLLARTALLGPFLENLLPTIFNMLYWGAWLILALRFQGLDLTGFWLGEEGWTAFVSALFWLAPAALALRLATEPILVQPDSPLSARNIPFLEVLQACFWPVTRDMVMAVALLFVYGPENPAYIARVISTILAAAIAAALRHSKSQRPLAEAATSSS